MIPVYLLLEQKLDKPAPFELLIRSTMISVGIVVELLFRQLGLTDYPSVSYFVPPWLFLVWISFGFTFSGCYRWLGHHSTWLAVLLGAVFGPVTYWIASRLAPFQILEPILFTVASSLFWAVLYGVAVEVSRFSKQQNTLPATD